MGRFSQIVTALALCAFSSPALGVTAAPATQNQTAPSQVTTTAADRASTDVQIRRLRQVMTSDAKHGEQARAFQEMERLQQKLRGQK